jgi:L-lactate dehydrogenase complex protein LldG
MTSRDKILNSIKSFQSNEVFELKTDFPYEKDITQEFIKNAKLSGAQVYTTSIDMLDNILIDITQNKDDFFIYDSHLGVAENGAIWCHNLQNDRKKLFLSNDLIITIKKEKLVANMHKAYDRISFENREFGVFMSGPSKTADIEQALVIGAHGAMGLHLIVID